MINGDTMAESFIDKYIPEVNKIFEAVKFATVSRPSYSPKTKAEKKEYSKYMDFVKQTEKDQKELDKEDANPLISEAISIIGGSRSNELDSNAKLNNWINDKILALTKWITVNDSKSNVLQHPSTGSLVKETITNVLRSALTNDTLMAGTAGMFGGRHGKNIYNTYTATSRLPAYAKLGLRQFVPEGLEEYKDEKTGEIKTRRTYEPISDLNRKEWFNEEEVENISNILKTRDKTSPYYIDLPPGEVDSVRHKEVDPDALINNSLGKFKYGSYDETGKWQEGLPNLDGTYTIKDTYNWDRDYGSGIGPMGGLLNKMRSDPKSVQRRDIEGTFQAIGPQHSQKEGREIEFTVPTYKTNTPEGATAWMDVMASRLGPYEGKSPPISSFKTHWLPPEALSPLQTRVEMLGNRVTPLGQGDLPGMYWQDEAFSTAGDTSLDTGTADPGQGGDFSTTEDQGYSGLDIGYRRGGQISQGLDNLYMNKRDSKQKLNNMMGFQERQYGGGLDDTYLNMSRRRSNAFADPNANTAFDSPMSIGGLPTVYRDNGGLTDPGGDNFMSSNLSDPSDPNDDWNDPANWAKTGLLNTPAPPAPPAPTTGGAGPDIPDWAWSVDDKGISSIVGPEGQVDPKYEHAGSGIEGRQELLARWRGKKEADGMTRMEYTYLNDIRDKTGMTMPKAEEYLASVMATPGGVAAMEQGFHGSYTGGGPFGTIGNFIGGIGDDLGMAGIYERERKRQQADKDFKAGFTGEDPSILTNIQDTVSRYFKGREGITTIEGQEEFKAALERQGHTFTPKTQSDIDKYIGYGLSMVNPLSSVASIGEFITGATPLGTITSKEGLSFTLDANGKVIPEQFFKQDIDYGPDPSPKKPVPKKKKKKILPEEEEEEKSTPKNNINSPRMKASNIESLKTYMSLTGKDLSDSKQDLAITDISITEEDFT